MNILNMFRIYLKSCIQSLFTNGCEYDLQPQLKQKN